MSERVLSFGEVKANLRELQRKYGFSSREFLSNPQARTRVSDEDEFRWEAYLAHLDAIREYEEELHREYLSRVVPPLEKDRAKDKMAAQLALAA